MIEESNIAERKSFLRSFIKRIEINRNEVVVHYHLLLPQNEKGERVREVLLMVTPGGAGVSIGRTFSTTFALVY